MTVPKPTLLAYSPGHPLGYKVTDVDYNNDSLQQGAWTQLMLGAATAFPASPASGDTCFRSDLGAWFRYDGAAWQQMGLAFFTTATRPAAPPTNYRYADLTDGAIYRYNGTTYDGAWVAPTLINSWVNAAGGNAPAGYYKDASGSVHLRGTIKTGTMATVAYVLAAGNRPAYLRSYTTVSNSAFAYFFVDTSGNVEPFVGSNVAFSFDETVMDLRT
jgi:hypothetical protein